MKREIDIICVGEILIDFIGHQAEAGIFQTEDYHRYVGGSPTNVAVNMARLGLDVYTAASLGEDGLGDFCKERLKEDQLSLEGIRVDTEYPTSMILVSRTTGTPDFIPYRSADMRILEEQIPTQILERAQIFHTTAFALSKEPAQATILHKAKEAHRLGCRLSIDFNYSERIWEDREKAVQVLSSYCQFDPLLKISMDDMDRWFGKRLTEEAIFKFFHEEFGVSTVCLTLGSKGVVLSRKHKKSISIDAQKIDKVIDATGAGDAFWSGFLLGYLKKLPWEHCLEIGLSVAAIKLQNLGGLPKNTNLVQKLLRRS